jgi:hypothetical protein
VGLNQYTISQFKVLIPCNIKIARLWMEKFLEVAWPTSHPNLYLVGCAFLQISEGVDGVVESLLLARVVEMKMKLFFMCFVIASMQLRYGFTSFLLIL